MLRLIAVKLLRLVPVLFIVSLGTFFLLELVPGDPVISVLGDSASPEEYDRIYKELGLDQNIFNRYFSWLGDILTGDLGEQLTRPGFEVSERIEHHLPVTLQIAAMGMGMALLAAIPLGVWTAYRSNSRLDKSLSGAAFAIISIPSFLAGLLLIFFFVSNEEIPRYLILIGGLGGSVIIYLQSVFGFSGAGKAGEDSSHDTGSAAAVAKNQKLKIIGASSLAGISLLLFFWWPDFPRQGFVRLTSDKGIIENLRSAFLPSLTIALTEVAVFMRLLRSDMIATLREDFVLSARAKGMPMRRILFVHSLRPSSFSLITLAGVAFGRLIGGTVIVETIFNLPGMGTLIIGDGVTESDYNVVQAGILVLAGFYVLLNVAIDISYVYLDPRIRRSSVGAKANA